MATRVQASSRRTSRQTNRRATHTDPHMYGTAVSQLKSWAIPRSERRPGKPASSQSVRHSHRIRRNQERVLYMDFPCVIVLTIAPVFTLYPYTSYLHAQSSTTVGMHNIEKMETQLEQFKTESGALKTSVNTSIDLSEIYGIATKELEMVYAKKD